MTRAKRSRSPAAVATRLLAVVLAAGCSRGSGANALVTTAREGDDPAAQAGHAPHAASTPMEPGEPEDWSLANQGDEDALVRLAHRLGCDGLRERAGDPGLRLAAVRAMAACDDFTALPFLVEVAATGTDPESDAALGAILAEAARPRRARDPEDAEELGAGCRALLAYAREPGGRAARGAAREAARDAARDHHVDAVRALRMLADRGCVARGEIPADLDGK